MALEGQQLLEYAYGQFEKRAYDAALEAFILAYVKGYEREWTLENIYNCYMSGNEAEFQKTYGLWGMDGKPKYEELTLDFIPYREGEYYIFDKELRNFRGIFSVGSIGSFERQEDFRQMEFSALAVSMHWDWSRMPEILAETEFHKIYAVCKDMNRCAAFFKIPELAEYAKNIVLFPSTEAFQKYFHEHTSVYLPKICTGEEGKKELLEILNQEHAYRLTPEGRNGDHILLTIAIPTRHRGNLLLKRLDNLLLMAYDAEIEIVISKNGMGYYDEEYEKVSQIEDARLHYYAHGKDLISRENWLYAAGMAHGRYVMFVSDEDDVAIEALEHYMKILSDSPQLSVVRARTAVQYCTLTARRYEKKGLNAFLNLFLGQNYLSGLIMRKDDLIQENLERLEEFSQNSFFVSYPHEWWCALLSRRGDTLREPVILIREGESVDLKEGKVVVLAYGTYESRIKQFEGMIDFLHWYTSDGEIQVLPALLVTITKTLFLMGLARNLDYEKEHFVEWIERFCAAAIKAIEEFGLTADEKMIALQHLKDQCLLEIGESTLPDE